MKTMYSNMLYNYANREIRCLSDSNVTKLKTTSHIR